MIDDREGNYLFRQMPAGSFTLAISYQGKKFKLSVNLPPTPALSRGNDFGLGRRSVKVFESLHLGLKRPFLLWNPIRQKMSFYELIQHLSTEHFKHDLWLIFRADFLKS
jgi:hypothetical protein